MHCRFAVSGDGKEPEDHEKLKLLSKLNYILPQQKYNKRLYRVSVIIISSLSQIVAWEGGPVVPVSFEDLPQGFINQILVIIVVICFYFNIFFILGCEEVNKVEGIHVDRCGVYVILQNLITFLSKK